MKKEHVLLIVATALVAIGLLAFLTLKGLVPLPSTQPQAPGCPSPSLVYVYENEQQKNAMDSITSAFKSILQSYYGINIINTPVCSVPASSLPQRLRVYPALLYKGDLPALAQFTSGSVGEYKVISPSISAVLAYYQGVSPSFGATAEAVIVESSAPFAKINISEQQLRDLLTQVALANISKISTAKPEDLGVPLQTLPAVVFRSDFNLSEGVPYLVKLRDNIYGLSNNTQRSLMEYLNVGVYETHSPPPSLLENGVAYGEDVPITLYILEDYHCPFCADLITNMGSYLQSLVKENRIRLVFVDLIVHPEVTDMHAFTRCVYNYSRDSSAYFNITRDLYASGVSTTLSDARKIALRYLPDTIVEKALACANSTVAEVQQNAQQLLNIGYTGTPTLFFWNKDSRKGLVVTGCLQLKPCITQEQFASMLSWLESQG